MGPIVVLELLAVMSGLPVYASVRASDTLKLLANVTSRKTQVGTEMAGGIGSGYLRITLSQKTRMVTTQTHFMTYTVVQCASQSVHLDAGGMRSADLVKSLEEIPTKRRTPTGTRHIRQAWNIVLCCRCMLSGLSRPRQAARKSWVTPLYLGR